MSAAPKIRDSYMNASEGWWVIDDMTGKRIDAQSYKALIGMISTHRVSNGKTNDMSEISAMVARQVCSREHESFCEEWPIGLMGRPVGDILPEPTVYQMAKNFITHIGYWVKKGYPLVTQDVMDSRIEICKKCPTNEFSSTKFFGHGKCEACGCCLELKPWLATSYCPRGHWKRIDT